MATKRRSSKQSGGTFLGVVLGLIVGLAIAVVVALYVTHAPTPFVARNQPLTASDASAQANVDPNRILQGNSPSVPITAQAGQPAPPNTAPGQPANQSNGLLDSPQIVEVPNSAGAPNPAIPAAPGFGTPAQPPVNAVANTPTAPTIASQPSATAQAAASAQTAQPANATYYLQVGAYKTQADAEQQRAALTLEGFDAKVSRRDSGNLTFYRVRIGPFPSLAAMSPARQRLSDEGKQTAIIRATQE